MLLDGDPWDDSPTFHVAIHDHSKVPVSVEVSFFRATYNDERAASAAAAKGIENTMRKAFTAAVTASCRRSSGRVRIRRRLSCRAEVKAGGKLGMRPSSWARRLLNMAPATLQSSRYRLKSLKQNGAWNTPQADDSAEQGNKRHNARGSRRLFWLISPLHLKGTNQLERGVGHVPHKTYLYSNICPLETNP